MRQLSEYFQLRKPPALLGGPSESAGSNVKTLLWNISFYAGTSAGVLGQFFYETTQGNASADIPLSIVLRGLVVGAVILPTIYKIAQLDQVQPNFIHVFICFQHGFFWQSLMAAIGPLG